MLKVNMRTPLQWLKDEGLFGWNYKHLLTHPWVIFKEIYYHTKWFIQRGHRGYADCDQWSIDGYLNRWMPTAIRGLKSGLGYPMDVYCELFPDDNFETNDEAHSAIAHAKWHEILELIAAGFEAADKLTQYDFKGATEWAMLQLQMNEGLSLFRKYYLNLWD